MITSTPIFSNELYDDFIIYNDESHNEYLVTIDKEEETVYCTCPDFKYRKDNLKFGGAKIDDVNNHCKHIKKVMEGMNEQKESNSYS